MTKFHMALVERNFDNFISFFESMGEDFKTIFECIAVPIELSLEIKNHLCRLAEIYS